MIETDYSSSKLDQTIALFYTTAEASDAFAGQLESRLRQQHTVLLSSQTRRQSFQLWRYLVMNKLQTRPLLALAAALIFLSLLAGVAYAIVRLAGFIPGFGFTPDVEKAYLLSEQAEIVNGDITLKLVHAVSDENRFWVDLRAEGLSDQNHFSQAFVKLPNGSKIPFHSGGSYETGKAGMALTFDFPPLPADTRDLMLLVENIGGQTFSVPLNLRPAQKGDVLPAEPDQPLQLRSESHDGVTLLLDHMAAASDKTIFQISLQFDKPGVSVMGDWNVVLTDETGALYPALDITPATMSGNAKLFSTLPFSGKEKLTIKLNVFPNAHQLPLLVSYKLEEVFAFDFDPGQDAKAGKVWQLDHEIEVDGFKLRAVRAELNAAKEIQFTFKPGENVTGVMLYAATPLVQGNRGGVPESTDKIQSTISFTDIPTQPFKVYINTFYYQAQGDWQVAWQPPAAPEAASAPLTQATVLPTIEPTARVAITTDDPLLSEVLASGEKFGQQFHTGPAWIHAQSEREITPRKGQMMPSYILTEQWFEIDANGYVTRMVWQDKDKAGNVFQLSATVGDYSVNFTTGDGGFGNGVRYQFMPSMLDLQRVATDDRLVLTTEEGICDNGTACVIVTTFEAFEKPITLAGFPQLFSGMGHRVWIDRSSGQEKQFQSFGRLEDGSENINETQRYLILEKIADAPQEILDILTKVSVPAH